MCDNIFEKNLSMLFLGTTFSRILNLKSLLENINVGNTNVVSSIC